jgi:hypothetical protein
VYVQAVAGGRGESGVRSVNQAFRVFHDVDGQLSPERKLVVLSDDDQPWRREDLELLGTVAYVAGWWAPAALDDFLERRTAEHRLLFPEQTALPS